jgi:N-acetylmuramic acid 6-phosphate etherase
LGIGIIAGGDTAIRKSVEHAEDDAEQAWHDIMSYGFNPNDTVIGIAASGTTPYAIGGVRKAKEKGLLTGSITCNEGTPLSTEVDVPIVAVVGQNS